MFLFVCLFCTANPILPSDEQESSSEDDEVTDKVKLELF